MNVTFSNTVVADPTGTFSPKMKRGFSLLSKSPSLSLSQSLGADPARSLGVSTRTDVSFPTPPGSSSPELADEATIVAMLDGTHMARSYAFLHRFDPPVQLQGRKGSERLSSLGFSDVSWTQGGQFDQQSFSIPERILSHSATQLDSSIPSPKSEASRVGTTVGQSTTTRTHSATQDVYSLANERTQKFISSHIQTRGREQSRRRAELEVVWKKLRLAQINFKPDVPSYQERSAKSRILVKKCEAVVESVFTPMCAVLEEIWASFHIGHEAQRQFRDSYFFPHTHENYLSVSREVVAYSARLMRDRGFQRDVVRLITLREMVIKALGALAQSPSLVQHEKSLSHDGVVARAFNLILSIRQITCRIIDEVYESREAEGRAAPLLWDGKNYLVKMQDDLGFLETSCLSLMMPEMRFRTNPMLLPPRYFARPTSASQRSNPKSEPPTVARGSRVSTPTSSHAPEVDTTRQQQQLSPHGTPTPLSPTTSARVSRPQSSASMRHHTQLPLSCVPGARPPPLVILGEGEVHVKPGSALPTQRQEFFTALARQEFRESRRQTVERVNIYKYPLSVYDPPPRPYFVTSGERLQRSLDPAVKSRLFTDSESKRYRAKKDYFAKWMNPPEASLPPKLSRKPLDFIIDEHTGCYRPFVDLRELDYSELHQREVLLFAENDVQRRETMRGKRRRGFFKLRAAYRGFVVLLQRQRLVNSMMQESFLGHGAGMGGAPTAKGGVREFASWVRDYAPQWLPEAIAMMDDNDEEFFQLSVVDD